MLKPVNEWIIVEKDKPEDRSRGGIYLPDNDPCKRSQTGRVVAVGPGKWLPDANVRVPMDVKVGDRVLFLMFGGTEVAEGGAPVQYGGKSYLFLRSGDVLAVLPEQK